MTIDDVELRLTRLLQSSPLREEFNGSLYTRFQSSIEDVIGAVGKVTGIDSLERNKRAISSLIVIMIIGGALYVWHKQMESVPPAAITGDYNVFISIASENLGKDSAEIEKAIDMALKDRDKRALSHDAADFVAPARRGGAVEIDGVGTLSSGAIAAVPDHGQIDAVEGEEFSETRENVEIHIRALDLDRAHTGWAGIITVGDEQRRIKMVIVPGIDLNALKAETDAGSIRGDVEIFYRRARDGEWQPYAMHLYRVHPQQAGTETTDAKENERSSQS